MDRKQAGSGESPLPPHTLRAPCRSPRGRIQRVAAGKAEMGFAENQPQHHRARSERVSVPPKDESLVTGTPCTWVILKGQRCPGRVVTSQCSDAADTGLWMSVPAPSCWWLFQGRERPERREEQHSPLQRVSTWGRERGNPLPLRQGCHRKGGANPPPTPPPAPLQYLGSGMVTVAEHCGSVTQGPFPPRVKMQLVPRVWAVWR